MNYYQFHIGDYTTATAHLSMMEDLAYRRLIDLYYLNGHAICGSIDTIARRIRMGEHRDAVEQVLREFFEPDSDEHRWENKRCDEEIFKAAESTEEADARRENERERQRRHRERRKEIFAELRLLGEVPAYDTTTEALEKLLVTAKSRTCHGDKRQTQRLTNNQEPITNNQVITPLPPKGELVVPESLSSLPGWQEAWDGFVEMRKKHKMALTDRAKSLALTKLQTLKDPVASLNEATLRCWRGLFDTESPTPHSPPPRKPEGFKSFSEVMADA